VGLETALDARATSWSVGSISARTSSSATRCRPSWLATGRVQLRRLRSSPRSHASVSSAPSHRAAAQCGHPLKIALTLALSLTTLMGCPACRSRQCVAADLIGQCGRLRPVPGAAAPAACGGASTCTSSPRRAPRPASARATAPAVPLPVHLAVHVQHRDPLRIRSSAASAPISRAATAAAKAPSARAAAGATACQPCLGTAAARPAAMATAPAPSRRDTCPQDCETSAPNEPVPGTIAKCAPTARSCRRLRPQRPHLRQRPVRHAWGRHGT
jgi:hypothetical protein